MATFRMGVHATGMGMAGGIRGIGANPLWWERLGYSQRSLYVDDAKCGAYGMG